MKLKKCVLLLPTTYNDGSNVAAGVLSSILRSIDETFDGHTVDGYCDGVYRMDDGSLASDHSLKNGLPLPRIALMKYVGWQRALLAY